VFWALAVILVAVAGFTVLVTFRHRPAAYGRLLDLDQLRGFVYVGAGALGLLALAVIVLGLLDDGNGRAEAVAVLGFFAYAVYLAAAGVITYAMARR
jgi:uncharacterized membrane protein